MNAEPVSSVAAEINRLYDVALLLSARSQFSDRGAITLRFDHENRAGRVFYNRFNAMAEVQLVSRPRFGAEHNELMTTSSCLAEDYAFFLRTDNRR